MTKCKEVYLGCASASCASPELPVMGKRVDRSHTSAIGQSAAADAPCSRACSRSEMRISVSGSAGIHQTTIF